MDQALASCRRLLALVALEPRARKLGQRIHVGEFPAIREQGPRGCAWATFVSRVTKFCRSKFGEDVPAGGAYGDVENALIADLQTRVRAYEEHMDAMEVRKAASELRAIWAAGNEYLQAGAPWVHVQRGPRTGRRTNPFGAEPCGLLRHTVGPLHPRCQCNPARNHERHRCRVAHGRGRKLGATARRARLHCSRGQLCQNQRRATRRLARTLCGAARLSATRSPIQGGPLPQGRAKSGRGHPVRT